MLNNSSGSFSSLNVVLRVETSIPGKHLLPSSLLEIPFWRIHDQKLFHIGHEFPDKKWRDVLSLLLLMEYRGMDLADSL
jgi:hypothetical protein